MLNEANELGAIICEYAEKIKINNKIINANALFLMTSPFFKIIAIYKIILFLTMFFRKTLSGIKIKFTITNKAKKKLPKIK